MTFLKIIEKSIDTMFAYWPRRSPKGSATSDIFLVAHRGAHSRKEHIIENTDTAFSKALELGCWGIEFDVHATADGVLVVNHDDTLNRLWGKPVAIKDLSFAKLRKLVPEIVSLSEVVERYGKRLHLFVELKEPFNAEASLVHDLRTLTPCADYHLLSLDEPLFASLTSFLPETMLLVAVHNNVNQFSKLCLEKQYGGVLGHYLLLNGKTINRLQSAKKIVGLGMIDSKFSLYRELSRGVPLVFTNNVAVIAQHLKVLQHGVES